MGMVTSQNLPVHLQNIQYVVKKETIMQFFVGSCDKICDKLHSYSHLSPHLLIFLLFLCNPIMQQSKIQGHGDEKNSLKISQFPTHIVKQK